MLVSQDVFDAVKREEMQACIFTTGAFTVSGGNMSQNGAIEINGLISEFMDLQEQWARDPSAFDWKTLQALAQKGASAYNEGNGPSFHMLALDGVRHSEFHERFLAYSLEAGFDPFKLARAGSGNVLIPVLGHSGLAEAANMNPSSAQMRASLMEIAQKRFGPLAQEGGEGTQDPNLIRTIEACAESIPLDLLAKFVPELAKSHTWATGRDSLEAVEGMLSDAELIADNISKPYG
jgi:hypothetical protein